MNTTQTSFTNSISGRRLAIVVLALFGSIFLTACATETDPSIAAAAGASVSADGKINLNNMTRDQLTETIPDFSGRMVREFFEYQPYTSIGQFRQEIGKYVDDAQVADYEQYIFVPIDVNSADSATLQQAPGIDANIADLLIAARPFDTNDAFLDTLSEHLSAEDLAAVGSYLSN